MKCCVSSGLGKVDLYGWEVSASSLMALTRGLVQMAGCSAKQSSRALNSQRDFTGRKTTQPPQCILNRKPRSQPRRCLLRPTPGCGQDQGRAAPLASQDALARSVPLEMPRPDWFLLTDFLKTAWTVVAVFLSQAWSWLVQQRWGSAGWFPGLPLLLPPPLGTGRNFCSIVDLWPTDTGAWSPNLEAWPAAT